MQSSSAKQPQRKFISSAIRNLRQTKQFSFSVKTERAKFTLEYVYSSRNVAMSVKSLTGGWHWLYLTLDISLNIAWYLNTWNSLNSNHSNAFSRDYFLFSSINRYFRVKTPLIYLVKIVPEILFWNPFDYCFWNPIDLHFIHVKIYFKHFSSEMRKRISINCRSTLHKLTKMKRVSYSALSISVHKM